MAPSHPLRLISPGAASPTEAALCAWIGSAAPGEHFAYHRGFLACDLAPETELLDGPARAELGRVASRARRLAEQGYAHLVQRREGSGDYTYLVIAAHRPRTNGGALALVLAEGDLQEPLTASSLAGHARLRRMA